MLRFDIGLFLNDTPRLLIEIDGYQHFVTTNAWYSENLKKNDQIKLLNSQVVDFNLEKISKNRKVVNGIFRSFNVFSDLSPEVFKDVCTKLKSKYKEFLIILMPYYLQHYRIRSHHDK